MVQVSVTTYSKPKLIAFYNTNMGGVDRCHQLQLAGMPCTQPQNYKMEKTVAFLFVTVTLHYITIKICYCLACNRQSPAMHYNTQIKTKLKYRANNSYSARNT